MSLPCLLIPRVLVPTRNSTLVSLTQLSFQIPLKKVLSSWMSVRSHSVSVTDQLTS